MSLFITHTWPLLECSLSHSAGSTAPRPFPMSLSGHKVCGLCVDENSWRRWERTQCLVIRSEGGLGLEGQQGLRIKGK